METLDQSLADRLRDLIATGEKQRARKSFDAAADTFRTALAILPADADAEIRENLEWRLSTAECARNTTRSVSRLLAEARYDQTAGRLADSYRHVTEALSLDPASQEAAALEQQLAAHLPPSPQVPLQTAPYPAFEVESCVESEDVVCGAPNEAAPVADGARAELPGPIRTPSFALLEDDNEPTADETLKSVAIMIGSLALALAIMWVPSAVRRPVNLDAPPPGHGINLVDPTGYEAGNGVRPPVLISRVEPEYSEEGRSARLQGTVLLEFEVDAHGTPANLRVLHTLGLGLDEKAVEAVGKWRFAPGIKDGVPVAVKAQVAVTFRPH